MKKIVLVIMFSIVSLILFGCKISEDISNLKDNINKVPVSVSPTKIKKPTEAPTKEIEKEPFKITEKFIGKKLTDYEYPDIEMYVDPKLADYHVRSECYKDDNYYEKRECTINVPQSDKTYSLIWNDSYEYTLFTEDGDLWNMALVFGTHDPIKDFFVVGEDVVIGYEDISIENDYSSILDVVVNGNESMNEKFGFTNSFAPTSINNKLLFFGEKNGKYEIVYGEIEYPLSYSSIVDPPCCEPAAFAVVSNENIVVFYALKDEDWYQVKLRFDSK